MDTNNIKTNSYSSADTLNNRLTRLENILQQLLGLSGNINQNSSNSLINGEVRGGTSNLSDKLLEQISGVYSGRAKTNYMNDSKFTIRDQRNNPSSNANNLLLSHSQIIAEIASAINHIGNRNS